MTPAVRPTPARATPPVFCAVLTRHWLACPHARACLRAAIAAHTPIRLVLMPGVRIPWTLAQGAEDLAVFQVPRTPSGQPNAVAAAVWIGDQVRALRPEKGERDAHLEPL